MEEAKQGAADIEKRKEIEIRIMQIKIKRHAQNNQIIAIPTKIGMQSKRNLWKTNRSRWGGEGKNQTPSNQKGLQDQKASLRTLPKKKDHVRVECMPTYKKVLHAGVQSTPLQGTQLILPFTIAFNLGNPDLLPSGLASA